MGVGSLMEDGGPLRLLLLFALFLVGGAYFAGAEIALASVNKIRLMTAADDGDRRAKRVLYILDHFDKALTTLLIGNNVMHIGCATVSTLIAARYIGAWAVAYGTLITTCVVFLLSEMLPKCFAKSLNERFALAVAGSLTVLMKALSPLVWVFAGIAHALGRPFERAHVQEPTVTEDELHEIIESITEEGALDEDTSELMQSAMEYTQTTVAEILTPWEQALTLSEDADAQTVLAVIQENTHSRFPVVNAAGGVTGVLNIRKYLKAYLKNGSRVSLARVMDKPSFVQGGMPVDDLMPAMSAARTHFSLVTNDIGRVIGIVTMEDILETLVGEIYDEDDVEEAEHDG